jgi:ribosomal protein S2
MTNIDIEAIKAQAETLLTSFSQLNANFAKLPKEERANLKEHEQQLNKAIEQLKNEFSITE